MSVPYLTASDGVQIFYRDAGSHSAPPVLYLHGGPGEGSADFEGFQDDHLKGWARLVTLDQRGALRSPRIVGRITMDQLIGDIEALRVAIHIARWHVVGHSWGGRLAADYAARHPEHVASMALVCPALDWVESIQAVVERMAEQLAAEQPALAAEVRRRGAALRPSEPIWSALLTIWSMVPSQVVNDVYNPGLDTRPFARWLEAALAAGLFTEADRARATDVCEQLDWEIFATSAIPLIQRYRGPVQLFLEEDDPVCTPHQQAAVTAAGGMIHWLPGGHKPYVECSEQFAHALQAWVEDRTGPL